MGSQVALGSSRIDFGSILRGLGGVWGGFWDRFEGQNWVKLREKTSCYEFKWEKVFLPLAFSCFIDLGSILKGFGRVWGGFGDRFEGHKLIKLREKTFESSKRLKHA